MKIIYMFPAIIVLSHAAWSQTMSLHKYNGSVVEFQLSEVDSISFSVSQTPIREFSADVTEADNGEAAVQATGNSGTISISNTGSAGAVSNHSPSDKEGSVTRKITVRKTADINTEEK
ncbi:MAG: hypothetical protein ACM3SM_06455 [Bacteroidota bacterium]